MTVQELIDKLKECNPNDAVIKSKDDEGNGYDTVDTVSSFYNMDGEYQIEIGLRELSKDAIEQGYSEEDLLDGDPCVVLW